jgi:hypothetical protein
MKYAVLVYAYPAHTEAMLASALEVGGRKHDTLREQLAKSGELVGGAGLALPHETTALRLGSDGVAAEEGPLARRSSTSPRTTRSNVRRPIGLGRSPLARSTTTYRGGSPADPHRVRT